MRVIEFAFARNSGSDGVNPGPTYEREDAVQYESTRVTECSDTPMKKAAADCGDAVHVTRKLKYMSGRG